MNITQNEIISSIERCINVVLTSQQAVYSLLERLSEKDPNSLDDKSNNERIFDFEALKN